MMNIGGDPMDRSYRYKMPKLIAKVEGRGNGIKTRIPNCADIASALHRSPAVVTKFFGCELGAQSKWTDADQSSIVNGEHQQSTLQQKLCDEFIPKFVLCSNCGLPETDMKVRKDMVRFNCSACGAETYADMTHKLCTFILAKGTGDKKDKKEKKEKKDKKEKKEEKEKKEGKEKKSRKEKKSKKEESEDEIEWYTDLSEAAVEARRQESMTGRLADLVSNTTQAENDEDEQANSKDEAKADSNDDSGADAPSEDKDAEPAEEQAEHTESDTNVPEEGCAVAEAASEMAELSVTGNNLSPAVQDVLNQLLDKVEGKSKAKEIAKVMDSFCPVISESGLTSDDVIELIMHLPDTVAKHSPLVLKAMYDTDVLDEPTIVKWHESADKSLLVVNKATPFVEWLTAAEEESD